MPTEEPPAPFNVWRDGKVHVASAECSTCIFRPAARSVPGHRVAELIRQVRRGGAGSSIICHSTCYSPGRDEHAICRGWYDRLGGGDPILSLAAASDLIAFQEVS